ncbi:hypothetical protein CRYUN_Cryun17cG0097700 [Craigia yunnanensis]
MALSRIQGYNSVNTITTANGCKPVLFSSILTRKIGLIFKGVGKVRAALVSGEGDVLSYPNGNGVVSGKTGFVNGLVDQPTGIEIQPDAIGFGTLVAEITPMTSGFFADEYSLDRPKEGFASILEAIEDIRQGKLASPSMALFGAGAEIKHLEIDKRYLTVDVFHSNVNALEDKELLMFFEKYSNGSICSVHKSQANGQESDDKEKWGKITFLTPDAARKAAELDGVDFTGSALKVLPSRTSFGGDHKMFSFPAVKAKVYWPRRHSKGFGVVKCDLLDVGFIIDDFSNLVIGGKYIRCEVSRKSIDAVVIYGIDKELSDAEIWDALQGATKRKIHDFFLKIRCQQLFHSSISCSSSVYAVIKKQLDSLLTSFRHLKGADCYLEANGNGTYRVRISANATKTVAELRRPVEELMNGWTIKHANLTPPKLQHLFSRDGINLMRSLQLETRTYIFFDRHSFNVRIFGSPDDAAVAQQKLIQSLLSYHESKQLEVQLRGWGLPPDLMKEVVKKFGPDLHGLKEKIPGAEFTLSTRHHVISIRGDKETKRKVEEIVLEIAETGKDLAERSDSEVTCPICLCEVEDGYQL